MKILLVAQTIKQICHAVDSFFILLDIQCWYTICLISKKFVLQILCYRLFIWNKKGLGIALAAHSLFSEHLPPNTSITLSFLYHFNTKRPKA